MRQLVRRRLAAHLFVEPRILERDPRLCGNPLGQFLRFDVEPPGRRVQQELRVGVGVLAPKVERQRPGAPTRLAEPADLDAVMQHLRSTCARRLGNDLENQRHERARVVCSRERVADECDRFAGVPGRRVGSPPLVAQVGFGRGRRVVPSRGAKN